MPAGADRLQFAPPQAPGMLRAFGFAIVAHVLLMMALTWGTNWNREPVTLAAEAELWSSVPQQAAPKLVEVAPVRPPPVPVPAPVPAPAPAVAKPQPSPEPPPREADIAVEREKDKLAEAKRKQLALERERERKREAQRDLEALKRLEARQELEAQRKLDARKQQELAKARAADDQQKQEAARRRQADDAKRQEAQREDNLKRMQGMAGATGSPTASGNALRSSGPSDSYAGRIRARVKPNIVFAEDIAGNPSAEVEVRTSPDGTIVGQRISKSSGVRAWDEAVLKAVIKTEVLPRDVDGRVHSPLTIVFRPKD